MVMLHIFENLAYNTEVSNSFGNFLMYYLAGFTGAGTFMLCMGIGFGYTTHSEAKDFIKRGAITLLLAYVLNFLRAFTHIFFLCPFVDPAEGKFMTIYALFNVDIMQFAGLTLMVFGLFKLAKMKPWHMFLIAFGLSLSSTLFLLLHGQGMTGTYAGDSILSLFFPMWFVREGEFVSFFPLTCYLIFPITGYCISFYYKKLKNKKLFFGIAIGLAVIAVVSYILINPMSKHAGLFRENDMGYYHMYTWDALVDIISSMGLIGVCYFLTLILPKFILNGCHDISKNINKVYCISWVIIFNGIGIYEVVMAAKGLETPEIVPDWIVALLGIGAFAISCLIAHYYSKVKDIIKSKKHSEATPA